MGQTFSERFALKQARFFAVARNERGHELHWLNLQRIEAGKKTRKRKKDNARKRKRYRRLKSKAYLNQVLKMAMAAMGWKPMGPGKLSPKHLAAFHAGRDRYHAAKRNAS